MVSPSPEDVVCAVVVNWKGWRDTIPCVQSLLDLDDARLQIVICDNASGDGSVPQLQAWLNAHGQLRRDGEPMEWSTTGARAHGAVRIRLLALASNLGYAGGINAGIRWAQGQWQQGWFWLLNNDIDAQPAALRALLDAHAALPDAGICGSVLLEWDHPEQVQAVGGIYRRWLAVGFHAKELPAAGPDALCLAIDYPVGASMLVTQEYLQRVGLLEDSYFLYYEEMDWVERGRRHGYRPLVALRSRLRHKEGASTGSHGGVRRKSLLSERYGVINRLRITRRFWPWYLPTVWLSLLAVAGERVLHREFPRAALVLRLMFSPWLWLR